MFYQPIKSVLLPPAHVFSRLIGRSAHQVKRQSLCRVQKRHQDTHLSSRKRGTGAYNLACARSDGLRPATWPLLPGEAEVCGRAVTVVTSA